MSGNEPIVDVRGEMCPVPTLRVEQFLAGHASHAPFVVIGDHLPTLESLELLASRTGWDVTFEEGTDGTWRARFTPSAPSVPG